MLTARRLFGIVGPVLGAALLAAPVLAEEMKLKPVDQAGRDPAFAKFRTAMLDAVRRRDVDQVVAQADPEIKLSFGGDYGRETFRDLLTGTAEWQGEPYWAELQRVLELGGVFMDTNSFCTPYVACLDVPGCPDCDPYETIFTLSGDAVARTAPAADAPVAARLSYDVLRLDTETEHEGEWIPVFLPDGSRAYVSGPDFRMSIDYRALFEKVDGKWRMTVFIAGD